MSEALLIQMYGDKDTAVSNEVCSAMKELTHPPVVRRLGCQHFGPLVEANLEYKKKDKELQGQAARVFEGSGPTTEIENLSWWTTSTGNRLPDCQVSVEARKAGEVVQALITPKNL